MEDLALGVGVSVVPTINLTIARESGFRDFGVDGIVLAGNAGNSLLEHGNVVTPGSTCKQNIADNNLNHLPKLIGI